VILSQSPKSREAYIYIKTVFATVWNWPIANQPYQALA
jgi:hypothetical protein